MSFREQKTKQNTFNIQLFNLIYLCVILLLHMPLLSLFLPPSFPPSLPSLTHSLSSSLPPSLPLSLSRSVSFASQFPPITSESKRTEYKHIFNEGYKEYLELKAQIEVVTKEVTSLNEQMSAVKKGTEEAKVCIM